MPLTLSLKNPGHATVNIVQLLVLNMNSGANLQRNFEYFNLLIPANENFTVEVHVFMNYVTNVSF